MRVEADGRGIASGVADAAGVLRPGGEPWHHEHVRPARAGIGVLRAGLPSHHVLGSTGGPVAP